MDPERWLPVVGYEGLYSVSSWGRVRSEARTIQRSDGRTLPIQESLLKPRPTGRMGHLGVDLYRPGEKRKQVRVHQLVCEAFHGAKPFPDAVVRHYPDRDVTNNYAENLSWSTQKENLADRREHGTMWQLNRTHCPDGHEYTEENTYHRKDGGRDCRKCTIRRATEWNHRNRKKAV